MPSLPCTPTVPASTSCLRVLPGLQASYLELVASNASRPPGLSGDQLVLSSEPIRSPLLSKGSPAGDAATGTLLTVAAPLADRELRALLAKHASVRVVHLAQPQRLLSGFSKPDTARQFDEAIQKRVTYWCCRSPPDMKGLNLTERIQLVALQPDRYADLPPLDARSSYLHTTPPLPQRVVSRGG